MGKKSYLAMRAEQMTADLIASDLNDLKKAAMTLVNHAIKLGGIGFGTTVLEWVASAAAIYLLILDRTHWKTNILTGLLIPYIFFSLPSVLFNLARGEVGKWFALLAVVLRLFFPKHFPDWAELPAALILLIVVAPGLFAGSFRRSWDLGWVGLAICLGIACYLLQEHVRASGGCKKAFTKAKGLSNSIGILLLFIFPAWALIFELLSILQSCNGSGLGTSILQWIASVAAIILLFNFRMIMDQSSSRADIPTGLLTPYIFLTLPSVLFNLFRGEFGHWYVLIGVMVRLLFPKYVTGLGVLPVWLLIAVAPDVIPSTFRGSLEWVGLAICLAIVCYLLQEHVRASGGFREAFGEPRTGVISVLLVLVFIFPAWALMTYLF